MEMTIDQIMQQAKLALKESKLEEAEFLFKNIIQKHINSQVLVVDSANATAEYVVQYLKNKRLLYKNTTILEDKYYVSDKPTAFNHLAKAVLNLDIAAVQHIQL